MRGNAVIPAKLVPACCKQGAGIQSLEFVSVSNCLDARLRGHDGLRNDLEDNEEHTSCGEARQVGSKAKELLAAPGFSGKVLAVLSGMVYLSVQEEEILWVCLEGFPLHRRGIGVSRLPLVTKGENCFAGSSGLTFAGGPSIALQGSTEWVPGKPKPEDAASPAKVRDRFRRLLAVLDLLEIPDGLGPSISLVSALAGGRTLPSFPAGSLMGRVKDQLWDLAQGCRRQDLGALLVKGRELVGLGFGLTPSGDDFLGGLLFAAHFLHRTYPTTFPTAQTGVDELLDWARPRTHPISHAVLSDLAMGHGPEPLHDLVCILLRERENTSEAVDAAVRLTRMGHSSGWDMLAGFMTGMLMIEAA